MKLTKKQLNIIKKHIQQLQELKAVYASAAGLGFSDYYNCGTFEFSAITKDGIKYSDLIRFSKDELNELING